MTRLPPESPEWLYYWVVYVIASLGWLAATVAFIGTRDPVNARVALTIVRAGGVALAVSGLPLVLLPTGRYPLVWLAWVAVGAFLVSGVAGGLF